MRLPGDEDERDDDDPAEPVVLPIEDTLDLHSFPPSEVRALVHDWLDEVVARGFAEVRIIHGKGTGAQRRMVRALLASDPRVGSFGDAHQDASGWGATRVLLRRP